MIKITFTDQERLERFLELLPEKRFEEYVNELDDAICCSFPPIAETVRASREIFSRFINENLNDKYLLFIESLEALRNFVGRNFSYEDSTRCYGLLPEMRDSKDKTKQKDWDEKYAELRAFVFNTKDRYDDFLKTAKVGLSLRQEASRKTSDHTKTAISIDPLKGLCRNDGDALSYPIRKNSKRFKLVKLLFRASQSVDISTIKKGTKHHSGNLVIKEIGEINKLFRKKLEVEDDFIIHNETGGYSLNHEKFAIKNL